MKKIMTFLMLLLWSGIISTAQAADVLPEAGKTYFIKSDNVSVSKADEDYYLYNDNGSLKLSVNRTGANALWTCEKVGDYYRFRNQAGKYLGHRTLSDTGYDFKIDPSQKVNDGCLPLYSVKAERYMLVNNGGTAFDQATGKYDKASSGFSSDYIFEEFKEGSKFLTLQSDQPNVRATFSWNGESYTGNCSFVYDGESTVKQSTLTVQSDPASPYEFIGFYEGDQELGKTVEISSLTENRTITAKFEFNVYSATYGEKWIRVIWNSNQNYVMGLPVSESYADVAPQGIATDLGAETQLWCFVGTAESFKIYNKAAGETLALATASTNYGNGTATFMKAAASATSWHLVSNNGWNISPAENNSWGLNSYGGAGQVLKLYGNGDPGNIWQFQKSGENALTFQVVINGTPKALNTNIGQIRLGLGSTSSLITATLSQTEPQKFYLAPNVNLNFMLSGTQYRGYKFQGFRINGGDLQNSIENLQFDESLQNITAVYDVDTEDPSQYLFYTPGYQGHPYRIPAITTTKDNKLLAISDFRWCGGDIGLGHVDIVGRISADNGETWSDQFNIAVGSGVSGAKDCGYGDAAVVTDRESGKILIMCCTGNVFYSNGTRENPLRSARLYSDDNGKTWSTPEDITDQMYALLPQSTGQFIGAGKICQSRKVKVGEYYRLYAALCTRSGNFVIYSDDFGQTWAILGSNETSCAPNGDEPKCEELPDGNVVLSSRKYNGRYFNIYKFDDAATATGKWLGVVSSNDIEGGLKFGGNSTNGEIQLVKVIKKNDESFHYMMIQSVPYGQINNGDEARSNVCIFYKVFDEYTMNATKDLATGWTRGMLFENAKGAYSTMCIQPDKKLGFFYEEGPNNYCMVYRPISIEELTGDAYTMYDPAIHGAVDELQRAVDLEKAKVKVVLDEYADKNNDAPALGECTTATYKQLQATYENANKDNFMKLNEAITSFYNACNWPVFTINNMHPTYGVGKSIYDNNSGTLYFKETDTQDVQMQWKFNGLTSETMSNGNYIVTNLGTGRLFWDASFVKVQATNPETEGQHLIRTNGTEKTSHAQQSGSVIVKYDATGPNTGSAWSFTYIGSSLELEMPAVKDAFFNILEEAKDYKTGTIVGTYLDADGSFTLAMQAAQEAESNIDQLSVEEIRTITNALNKAMAKLTLNMPEAGKYYRIRSKSSGKYIAINSFGEKQNMVDSGEDINTIYYLSENNHLTGSNMLNLYSSWTDASLGTDFTFAASVFKHHYTIKPNNVETNTGKGYLYDHSSVSGKLDNLSNDKDEKCAWELIEVTDTELKLICEIGNTGYATLSAPVALNIPTGVKAYTVTADEAKETAVLEEVADVIPAGVAVLLKKEGSENSFDFTFAPEGSTENENSLTGVYVTTAISSDINAYILGDGSNSIGFYQMSADDRTLSANKAYLVLPAEAQGIRSIIIGGPTTGIEGTVAEGAETEEYYDLQGRRVMNPTKGIYVTKSGKKVIFN